MISFSEPLLRCMLCKSEYSKIKQIYNLKDDSNLKELSIV